ncbi:Crp/Fnr family transcriptional regulator [Paenibacillus chitinolyticus]|uniref:Crp/Fnr family transcriptional regulator n=1 Tax=Paenibacillus chitinolyticus TaxID=79263 RepID=UPI003D000DEE
MKEIQDRELLSRYMREHRLETVFNEALNPHLSLFSFEQGEMICSRGEPASYLYVLVKGKIKIYTSSAEGKTLILCFKTPIEVIGDIEYIRGSDIVNTVEAVSSVHMIGIHHRWLKKYGNDHAPLLRFLLEIITQKFYIDSNFSSFNLMYPVEVRLASYLLSVFCDESDNLVRGRLSTTHLMDAANLIGTSYRHLNRVIQKFCSEGLLQRTRGFITIKDREGLSAMAGHNIYE